MKCEMCGRETDRLIINMFNHDGSDSESLEYVIEFDEPTADDGSSAVLIDTNRNWVGYELSEEEMMEDIRCPFCRKFPFKHREVQVYEIIRIVCFKEE